MANKLWIGALAFSALLFGTMSILGIWLMLTGRESVREGLAQFLFLGLIAWRAVQSVISRIKYGSKGPPSDPLEDFHVDF